MYLRDSDRLQERIQLDLEAAMIIKILVACLGVGGVIFYLGLTLGQGDALAKMRGVSEADGLQQLEGSLRVLAPAQDPTSDGSLILFPTLLSRRSDQRVDQDELMHTLDSFRSRNLADQTQDLSQFSDQVLKKRFGLALDPDTGEVVQWDPTQVDVDGNPIPGGALAQHHRSGEAGAFPEDVEEAVEVEAVEVEAVDVEIEAAQPERRTIGKYTLQLQSFRDPDEARVFHELMADRGYHPFIQRVNLGDKGVWHRVRIGRFMKMKAAQSFKRTFEREQGFSTRIMSL